MTAVMETATRAQVLRESATALADPGLTAAVESFLAAHRDAQEAWDRFRLTDTGGWGGLKDEAEELDAKAEDAWRDLQTRFVFASPTSLPEDVLGEVLSAGEEYVERAQRRRRLAGHAVVQSGPCDWSTGR